jgi:hypothetical protein
MPNSLTKRRTPDHLFDENGRPNLRGSYIIEQALAVAITTMQTYEHPPYSDIEDMKALQGRFMRVGSARKLEKVVAALKRGKAVA